MVVNDPVQVEAGDGISTTGDTFPSAPVIEEVVVKDPVQAQDGVPEGTNTIGVV